MGYRVMQLKYEPLKENAIVEKGILLQRPYHTFDIGGVQIASMFTPEYDLNIITIYDYMLEDMGDGFKKIKLFTPIQENAADEEAIMLIVPYAYVIEYGKDVKRIAGRYMTEGVFILKPNCKIRVGKGEECTEEFAAVEFEKRMYMVKLYDE